MRDEKIKIGDYYQGKLSDVIVRALSGESSGCFDGIIIKLGRITACSVGDVSSDWCVDSFYRIDYKEQVIEESNDMFPIY